MQPYQMVKDLRSNFEIGMENVLNSQIALLNHIHVGSVESTTINYLRASLYNRLVPLK